jgi:hypothetical protein
MTNIIHLFTLTARFFTARTTEVFRTPQNKATGGHLILAALPVYLLTSVILPGTIVKGTIGLEDAGGCLRLKK